MDKSYVRLPVGLVDVALNENWERSLAYWIFAKSAFKNSCIYNFSLRKLSSVLKISHECARYHYNVWQREGLIKHFGKNLIFCKKEDTLHIAQRNSQNEYEGCIKLININLAANIADQIKVLKSRAVLKNINQQLRNIKLYREALQYVKLANVKPRLTKDEFKSYKKSVKMLEKLGKSRLKSINENVTLSDERISKLVGCSLSSAKVLKSFMKTNGIVKTEKVLGKLLDKCSKKNYLINKEVNSDYNSTFWHKGGVYTYPKTNYFIGDTVSPIAWRTNVQV